MSMLNELDQCKLYYNMDRKYRQLVKMSANIDRWLCEGNCPLPSNAPRMTTVVERHKRGMHLWQ